MEHTDHLFISLCLTLLLVVGRAGVWVIEERQIKHETADSMHNNLQQLHTVLERDTLEVEIIDIR